MIIKMIGNRNETPLLFGFFRKKLSWTFPLFNCRLIAMDKKKFLTYLALGSLLIAIAVLLMNFQVVVPFMKNFNSNVLIPVFSGVCIAYILNLVASKLEHLILKMKCPQKAARLLSIALALLLILATLFIVFSFVIPELLKAVKILITSANNFITNFDAWKNEHLSEHPEIAKTLSTAEANISRFISDLIAKIEEIYPKILSYTFTAVLSTAKVLITIFVSVIFGIYFCSSKERILSHIQKTMALFLSDRTIEKINHVGKVSNTVFSKYICAQTLEALILGSICFLGMLLFRLPYAPMIGALTGVMALIPIYGALISALFGAFMIAVISPWKGLFFLLFIFILQQTEGDLIYPRVVGTSLGLPSVYVFASVTILGALFGIVGMLFAVPISTIIYRLAKEAYAKKQLVKVSN